MSTSTKSQSKKASSTKLRAATSKISGVAESVSAYTPIVAAGATAGAVAATAPTASAASAPSATSSLISFPSPPPLSAVLAPPAGYIAATTPQFRGVLPLQAEQTSLEAAITDLGRIPNYALFVGAPPLAVFVEMLTLAGQWTDVRNASFKFDQYASTQEGNVWTKARPMMDDFRTSFVQAQKADPTLAAQLPGLTTFLGVRSAVAQKGASTKRLNKKAEAEGKRPVHGQVGKTRKRAAANAALAAADASATSAASTPAPVAATAPTPASAPVEGATTNGAGHS
jgi:hypothetical protein